MRPDGKVLSISSTGRAVFEADPAAPSGRWPLFMTGTFRDVTEERLAHEASIEQAKRDHYFMMLEKRLHEAVTARDAVTACCEELGRELGATFTGVAELEPDGEHAAVESAWRGDGRHFLSAGTDWPRPALFEARRSWRGILSRWRMSRETSERRTTRKRERSIPRSVCALRLTCLWRVQGEYARSYSPPLPLRIIGPTQRLLSRVKPSIGPRRPLKGRVSSKS